MTLPAPPTPADAEGVSTIARNVLLAALAALALVGGCFLVRGFMDSTRPVPEFASLADNPDTSLTGTVVFLKPYPDECIYSVAASGGQPTKVACIPGGPGDLTALPDGTVQSTRFPAADSIEPAASWIITMQTGDVTPTAVPEPPDGADPPLGPNGEDVVCASANGTLELTMATDSQTRSLLTVEAPETYCIADPAWSDTGAWFVAHDDADRLLLITTSDPSQTRVLVDSGWGALVLG